MKCYKSVISITLTVATVAGLQSVTYALAQHDFIAKQFGLQADQIQTLWTEAQAESPSIEQTGQPFFNHPPQLIRAAASQTGENAPSTYKFTLMVPQDAGQPLKAIAIAQVKNVETVKFDISNSKAFIGERLTADSEIQLASVGGNQPSNPGEATIVFDQPVQPGNIVTVELAVQRNPGWGGIYLFGVTAYPAEENGLGQFLGYGRISFDDHSD
jgi:hypothetical protein